MDKLTTVVFLISITIVIPFSIGLALFTLARLRRRSDQPIIMSAAGATIVPVRNLKRTYRVFRYAQNGINPQFEVAADGLRFKVLKPAHWPFADIARVDIFPIPFVTRLEIRSGSSGRLYIDVADRALAREFLRALPKGLPLTERAALVRDTGS